jgi:large subunit ribosomal protein L24
MMRVKKSDKVIVVSGKDKGKTGDIIAILPKKGKIMIKDVNIITRHVKARKQGDIPGIKHEESYIKLCKVMPICGSCKNPCRIGIIVLKNGKNARVCGKCKEIM